MGAVGAVSGVLRDRPVGSQGWPGYRRYSEGP